MDIRVCEEKDLEPIVEIEKESFDHPYSPYIFEKFLGSDIFLLAEVDEKVVGYIMGDIRGEYGLLVSIAVLPDFRREGIGTRLIDELIERMDVPSLRLTLRPHNRGAFDFYKNMGFRYVGVIKDYYKNDDNAIVMEKSLD